MGSKPPAAWLLRSVGLCFGEDGRSRRPPKARKARKSPKSPSARVGGEQQQQQQQQQLGPSHISAPTNFRHVSSGASSIPSVPPFPLRPPPSFPFLELHIPADSGLASVTHMCQPTRDGPSMSLTHRGSLSSMSFHLPRRPARETHDDSSCAQRAGSSPPGPPGRTRTRAYTSPALSGIYERVASAYLEKERLEAEINSVMERQSIYINSRPTTAYGIPDVAPMPSVPALPAAALSFVARLGSEAQARPRTAPPRPTGDGSHSVRTAMPPAVLRKAEVDRPLAPPLPLILRPPLRKKKSFSRVSSWLFPGSGGDARGHSRHRRRESVTNRPVPVTDRDGFYQCVVPGPDARPSSASSSRYSSSSGATADHGRRGGRDDDDDDDEEEEEEPTTTWSPASSPPLRHETPPRQPPQPQTRDGHRDRDGDAVDGAAGPSAMTQVPSGHRPQSVGVAL